MNLPENLVDARHLSCPLPLLKLKQALNSLAAGDLLHLIATDPTSKQDFISYIGMTHHQIRVEQMDKEIHFYVTKGTSKP